MRLVLCDALLYTVYDIEKHRQIYWAPKQLCLKISNDDDDIYLEIESNGYFQDGTKKRMLYLEEAFAIYFDEGRITALIQKQVRPFIRYALNQKDIVIGRDVYCDIVYAHPLISKQHCQLVYTQHWELMHLSEVNATYVNGQSVHQKVLEIGDWICIGGYELWFCECCLVVMTPDSCHLPIFNPHFKMQSYQKQEIEVSFSFQMEKPTLKLPTFPQQVFSMFQEIPLVVWMVLMSKDHQMLNWYMIVVIRLFMQVLQIPWWLMKRWRVKRRFRLENKAYQLYLEERFPDCSCLEKKFFRMGKLLCQEKRIVRLGKSKEGSIVFHHFDELSHLVIVGSRAETEKMIGQIVYQLMIFHPTLSLKLEKMTDLFWFCEARFQNTSDILWIGRKQNSEALYWIEPIDTYVKAAAGYDALIDLKRSLYLNHHEQILVEFDMTDTRYLFSHHFAFCSGQKLQTRPASYLHLVGLHHYPLETLRQMHHIQKELIACIGFKQDQKMYLDLNEHVDGPHILVAGMTGSGKSEWLLSFLLSLAIYYDSQDVQFFFIDFKGGGLGHGLGSLAHTTMILTDLEPFQIERAIAALQDEIRQREQLLLELARQFGYANMDIHDLKRMRHQKHLSNDLAHLMIIIDEFAELKRLYPEMMQELVRIARVGRSLGIHLILSTQRPSGVVDQQILSNIPTKISLKVASKQDSYDLLSSFDAAYLREPGEFYIQRQNNKALEHGNSMLVSPQKKMMSLYDENYNEIQHFDEIESKDDILQSLIQQINDYSNQTRALYYKDFSTFTVSEKCCGVYDDFKQRSMVMFDLLFPVLLVSPTKETLAMIMSHQENVLMIDHRIEFEKIPSKSQLVLLDFAKYFLLDAKYIENLCEKFSCIFVEKNVSNLRSRLIEKMSMVIYFEDAAFMSQVYAKGNLRCDPQNHIGILVKQGACYSCQIQK